MLLRGSVILVVLLSINLKASECHRPFHTFFLGPPAAGKGTVASMMIEKHGLCYIGVGNLLRVEYAANTTLAQRVQVADERGELTRNEELSNWITHDLLFPYIRKQLHNRTCLANGLLVDGSPRRVELAKELDVLLAEHNVSFSAVVQFEAPDDLLIVRTLHRLVHVPSGRTYHAIFKPPKVPGRDDLTGESLTRRAEDNEAALRRRIDDYRNITIRVIDHYRQKGLLHVVNSTRDKNVVFADVEKLVLH